MLKVHKLEDENKALKKQLGMPNGESLTASSDDNVFTAKVPISGHGNYLVYEPI